MSDAEAHEAALRLVRALADPERLRIAGLLVGDELSVEEIAAAHGLRAAAVSRHLSRLADAGLLTAACAERARRYRLDLSGLYALRKQALASEGPAAPAGAEGTPTEKVLRAFVEAGRLKAIPASLSKRLVVLGWLAEQFEPGTRYPEAEVNATLKRYHPDSAALRRELVDHGFLARERSIYWRTPSGVAETPEDEGDQ